MNIYAIACGCKKNFCHENCDPITECVNFIARNGNVEVKKCEVHESHTWHYEDECMKCWHKKGEAPWK